MIDRIARCWLESKNNATLFELAQKNLLVHMDSLAERSKAVAQGAIPKGRGFEPHSCQCGTRVRAGHNRGGILVHSRRILCALSHHHWVCFCALHP